MIKRLGQYDSMLETLLAWSVVTPVCCRYQTGPGPCAGLPSTSPRRSSRARATTRPWTGGPSGSSYTRCWPAIRPSSTTIHSVSTRRSWRAGWSGRGTLSQWPGTSSRGCWSRTGTRGSGPTSQARRTSRNTGQFLEMQ